VFASLFCGDLVHGDPDFDVRAFGFAGLAPGEERCGGPGVVARTVAVRTGFVVRETADDLKSFLSDSSGCRI